MPSLKYTVQNLIDEIRAQIDEQNIDSVDDVADILPTLNRAQDYAFDIYARRYPEPLLEYTTLALSGGEAEYDIPENVFEDRLLRVEIEVPSGSPRPTYREVQYASYKDITDYESSSPTNFPYYYTIYQRKIRLVPEPSGTYDARIWYLRNPEKLVLPQGRITVINSAANYVIVDSVGSDLSTEVDQLESYVNVIDGQTGEIKGSLQISNISDSNKITFRASPLRSTVLGNRAVSGSLPTEIALDDYLAPIDGTCVPYFGKPTSNFLIQYSVAELVRKLGGDAGGEEKVLEKFEKQIERAYARRPQSMRVTKRNQIWGTPVRRFYWD